MEAGQLASRPPDKARSLTLRRRMVDGWRNVRRLGPAAARSGANQSRIESPGVRCEWINFSLVAARVERLPFLRLTSDC
jgi:hypothetical protein